MQTDDSLEEADGPASLGTRGRDSGATIYAKDKLALLFKTSRGTGWPSALTKGDNSSISTSASMSSWRGLATSFGKIAHALNGKNSTD